MRVLHFLPVYAPAWQFGGPVLSVSRLCEALVKQGVNVRVITTNAGLPDFPPEQLGIPQDVNGVQVTYYPVDQHSGAIRSTALVSALPGLMLWADLLHLSSIWQPLGLSVQKAAHAAGVPVIQTLRGALGPYSWKHGWWKKIPYFFLKERPLLQRASAMHCTTLQEAREVSRLRLKPPITIIPNPLDLSQFRCSPDVGTVWRDKMNLPRDQTLFLVAGRLHHKKGLDLLPRALKSVAHLPWQILFIGNDEDGTGTLLKRELSKHGLNGRCHWLPLLPSDDLLGPYNAADWLLMPSRHENFGNVAIEALACGCGVLLTQDVGVAGSISSCPQVYVAPRRLSSWSALILAALQCSTRPRSDSAQWIAHHFSKEQLAIEVASIYNSIIYDE